MSSIAASSYSPTYSPPESAPPPSNRSHAAAERAARRPRAPPGLPVPARGPTPRAPPPLDLPGARPAPPCRRLALPPPERSHRRCPWPCAAVSRRASPPAPFHAPPAAPPPGRLGPRLGRRSAAGQPRRRGAPPRAAQIARRPAPEAGEREQLGRRPLSSGARLSAPPLLSFRFSLIYLG